MILAKVRVTARDVDDDRLLKEFDVLCACRQPRHLSSEAIHLILQHCPELNSSAIRFVTEILASTDISLAKKAAAQFKKLAAFLEENSCVDPDELDSLVSDEADALANRINAAGLRAQLDFLCEQLSAEDLLRKLSFVLIDET